MADLTLLDIADSLAKGQSFVVAARMAAHGSNTLENKELAAMGWLFAEAEKVLEEAADGLDAFRARCGTVPSAKVPGSEV